MRILLKREEEALLGLLREQMEIIHSQQWLLKGAANKIDEQQQLALAAFRSSRDLAVAFRIAQETPEIDFRDDLEQLMVALSDQVALMEEHAL